jgi:D-alanyl-D-alanine carboxypeptidase
MSKLRTLVQAIAPILLVAVVYRGPAPVRGQVPVSPAFALALQEKLDSCVNTYAIPGISATLLLPGDRYWNGASGLAHIYTGTPMDTSLLFQQASVTKLFTATLIMGLVEDGELDLDDSVGTFLPPITHVPGSIKVRHLLRHRSGLTDLLGDPGAANSWLLNPNFIWQPEQAIATFGDAPTFPQGTAFGYSNTNYMVLALLVEAVTGLPFDQALRTRILDPLGLEHTFYRPAEALVGQLVPGWSSLSTPNTFTDDMTFFLGPCFSSMVSGAGALVSRPDDMARFNRALFSGELLASATLDTMQVCTNVPLGGGCTGYGFGTMRHVFGGRTYYGHGGDINGYTMLTIHGITDSVTLALGINRNNAPRGPIAAALLQVVQQQLSVGLEERTKGPEVLVFPVPATDHVQVRLSEVMERWELVDARGATLRSATLSSALEHRLDLSGIPPGIVALRLVGRADRVTRNIVLE